MSGGQLSTVRRHDPVNDRQTKPGAVGAGMVRPAMPPHKFAKPIGRQALSAVTHRDHRIWANPYGHRAPGWRHPDSILEEVPQGGGDLFEPAFRPGLAATCIARNGFPFTSEEQRV